MENGEVVFRRKAIDEGMPTEGADSDDTGLLPAERTGGSIFRAEMSQTESLLFQVAGEEALHR